jgi:hypothetical protein
MILQKWLTLSNNSRIFKMLCGNLEKQHINLLLHTEPGDLAGEGLKGELQVYFQERRTYFAKCFEDEEWLGNLAYLADIFIT